MRRAVAVLVCGQRRASAQIGAHEERVDDASRGAGVGEPLVSPRDHAGQSVRRATEHARERGHLLDVVGRVEADALRIGAIGGVDLAARDVHAAGTRDAQMPGDGLEPVSRKLTRREIVAPHRIERIDQLPARRNEAHAAMARAAFAAAGDVGFGYTLARRAHPQTRSARPAQRDGDAEHARAPVEEREVEPVQVVVLDHIGVRIAHARHQRPDEVRFGRVALVPGFEDFRLAGVVADRDHENPVPPRIETRRLQVELQAMDLIERQVLEIGATGGDQVLLFRCEGEHRAGLDPLQLAQVTEWCLEAARRAVEDRGDQRASVARGDEVAERAGPGQQTVPDQWLVPGA